MGHQQLGIARTARCCRAVDGDDDRQGTLNGLDASVDVALHGDATILYLEYLLGIGYLGESQLLGHLRTYLSGVAIDSLTASDDDVVLAYLADGCREGIRCSQGVGTGKGAVGEQVATVSAAKHTFAHNLCRAGRAHREHLDRSTRILFLEAQGLLQGIQILGIEDCR